MRGLIGLGALLVVLWVVALLVLKVAGFFIHVLLLAGVALLVWGAIKRAT